MKQSIKLKKMLPVYITIDAQSLAKARLIDFETNTGDNVSRGIRIALRAFKLDLNHDSGDDVKPV